MRVLELSINDYFENTYVINKKTLLCIFIPNGEFYYDFIQYNYPFSNVMEIQDEYNRKYKFYIELVNDGIKIYILFNSFYYNNRVKRLFIIIDSKRVKHNYLESMKPLLMYDIEKDQLYREQEILGERNFCFYQIENDQYKEIYNIKGIECIGETSIFSEDKVKIDITKTYKMIGRTQTPKNLGFPNYFGGKRIGEDNRILGGFSNDIHYKFDVWNRLDYQFLGFDYHYGNLRTSVLDNDSSWGEGLNSTYHYIPGQTINFGDKDGEQITYIDEFKIYEYQNLSYLPGLHIKKSDYSNDFIQLKYHLENLLDKTSIIHIDTQILNNELSLFSIKLNTNFSNQFIRIDFTKQINDRIIISVYSENGNIDEYDITIPTNDLMIDLHMGSGFFGLYINNLLIEKFENINILFHNLFLIQGKEGNESTGKTHILVREIKVFDYQDYINDQDLLKSIFIPEIKLEFIPNDYKIKDFSIKSRVSMNLPSQVKQQQNIYPYQYDFKEVGEEYILDLQYKNFIMKYTMRVSVLDKITQNEKNIPFIENFIWRQLTPFYIREQVYEDENYMYNIVVKTLSNITSKLNEISYRYSDIFHPYDQDLFIKRNFYMYINDIGILKEYLSSIESNKQIYVLLSINFYKNIMYYTEYKGIYNCIDKILNDSFLHLSGILQLYVFIFRKLKNVQVYKFQTKNKLLKFESFLNDDGYSITFTKQKIYQYNVYTQVIEKLKTDLYIKLKYYKGVPSLSTINLISTKEIEKYLQSSIYRNLVVIYDDFFVKTYNMEDQLKTFFDFVKKNYLPQNMEIVYVQMSELNLNINEIENMEQGFFDFIHFQFNTLTEMFSELESKINNDTINNGKLR